MRRPGAPPIEEHVRFLSLDEVFPDARTAEGRTLGELFDADGAFREAVRRAARADMFVPDSRLSAEKTKAGGGKAGVRRFPGIARFT